MSASQSPISAISLRISGAFPVTALARTSDASHAVRATAAPLSSGVPGQSACSVPSRIIPMRPSRMPQPQHTPSLPLPRQMKCDVSHHFPPTAHQPHAHGTTQPQEPLIASPPPTASPHPDAALHAAARPKTDAALLEQMVSLRRAGKSLRQIGRQTGRCMESVRQALLRYEQARSETPAYCAQEEDWHEPLRDSEPLPAGHPIATQAIWRGLERWRDVV